MHDFVTLGWRVVGQGLVDRQAFLTKEANPIIARINDNGIIAVVDARAIHQHAKSCGDSHLVHLAHFNGIQITRPRICIGIVGNKLTIL